MSWIIKADAVERMDTPVSELMKKPSEKAPGVASQSCNHILQVNNGTVDGDMEWQCNLPSGHGGPHESGPHNGNSTEDIATYTVAWEKK